MPELPEVETVVRGLRPRLEGRRLVQVEQRCQALRWPLPHKMAERLRGRRVEQITRRAKYMLFHLDDGQVLLCHLGMSGRMVMHEGEVRGEITDVATATQEQIMSMILGPGQAQ